MNKLIISILSLFLFSISFGQKTENLIEYKNEDYQFVDSQICSRLNNIYVYMGFGNGLSVDKSIYRKYEPYLLDEVKKIKNKHNEKEESPSVYYPAWKPAVENMLNNK